MSDKRIVIIAGPNGAGKTTFAKSFLPNEAGCPDFINADLIAQGLSPFAPEKVAIRAGKLMLEEIFRRVDVGYSFAFETTLSGFSYARHIPRWRKSGYHVKLLFLKLPSAELAVARVRMRSAGRAPCSRRGDPPPVCRRICEFRIDLPTTRGQLGPV